jgi:UPF0271 protein
MGESFGAYHTGADAEVLPFVSSVNLACGFHGGDPSVMDRSVAMAVRAKVAIGAHPSHYDLRGFGRRRSRPTRSRSRPTWCTRSARCWRSCARTAPPWCT